MKNQKILTEKLTQSLLKIILKEYDAKKILLVHGKYSFSACGAECVFNETFGSEIEFAHYSEFSDNPTWEDVEPGLSFCGDFKPDLIFAVGGGSSIDTAKLIRFFNSYSGNFTGKEFQKEKELIPLIAVPTTAGSGAESTHFAVCFENDVKYSVSHDDILPDMAILDWTLAKSNSDYTTACTGFDALSQAIESFWAVKSTDESRKFAKQAIEIIFPILDKRELFHTDDFRRRMMDAANLSGRAINISTTTAAHAFSYKITSLLGLPHGHAVAVSLPYFFGKCFSRAEGDLRETMNELMKTLNLKSETKSFFEGYVKRIFDGLYTPKIPNDDEWNVILKSVNMERLSNFPIPLDEIQKSDFLW